MKKNTATGKLIILSAPSGAGKTTIARHLLQSDLNLEFSISACSREKRDGEIHGVDYYFLSVQEFINQIKDGNFLEWEEVYQGHYYGTLKSEVERIINSGRNVLFDVDVVGGLNIKKQYKAQSFALFIQPPGIEVLESRLRARSTESEAKILMRLEKSRKELNYARYFDRIIINDDLAVAVEEAENAVREFLTY